jgi:hypothetical protein
MTETMKSIDEKIAVLNARISSLEKNAAPAEPLAPEPIHWTGIRRRLSVVVFTDGFADTGGGKRCWSMEMAISEAETIARKLGYIVKRVPWNKTISDIMPPRDVQRLTWQEADKIQKGHNAILILDEAECDWAGTKTQSGSTGTIIHSWIFANNQKPDWMVDSAK